MIEEEYYLSTEKIKSFYFIGIGGIGMSALARYFNASGKHVCGYDRVATSLTDELMADGIDIHFEEDIKLIPKTIIKPDNKQEILVIYTPAISDSHEELSYFQNNGFLVKKRAEVLSSISHNKYTIAVAGTHGKTTVSSMIAHVLASANINCTAFLGGISKNYNSNLVMSGGSAGSDAERDTGEVWVVEADEYDRSFLKLHPDIAVITSMDADHLDIYGEVNQMRAAYNLFVKQIKNKGLLISKSELPLQVEGSRKFFYSIVRSDQNENSVNKQINSEISSDEIEYKAKNLKIENGRYIFDIQGQDSKISDIKLGMYGLHNVENATAAIAVAQVMGINEEKIREAMSSFEGIKRRFEYQVKSKELVFIDDYAHHPEEIKACITAVRQLYPGKKITGVFQPHLFTRTRDFADDFAISLAMLDELILLDIYPARELPVEGVNSQMLLGKIDLKNKTACSKSELIDELTGREIEVLVTMGAGDIDKLVEPVRDALIKNSNR